MHITVTGRHLDVGASLRRRVEEGLAAAVAKYFDRAIESHVTFDKRGQFFLADLAVHVGRGIVAHSSGEADDPYVAFSAALDHLAKRLRRHKRRLRDHHNATARAGKTEEAIMFATVSISWPVSCRRNDSITEAVGFCPGEEPLPMKIDCSGMLSCTFAPATGSIASSVLASSPSSARS